MGSTFQIQIRGMRDFDRALRRLKDEARKEGVRCIRRSALRVERQAKRLAVVDTGRLRASISTRFTNRGLSAEVGANVDYAPFVEFGTGALGARTHRGPLPRTYSHGSQHRPPSQALVPWVRRHSRGSAENLRAIAFLIARAIARRGGLPARPFLGPAVEAERDNYFACMRQVINTAARRAKQ